MRSPHANEITMMITPMLTSHWCQSYLLLLVLLRWPAFCVGADVAAVIIVLSAVCVRSSRAAFILSPLFFQILPLYPPPLLSSTASHCQGVARRLRPHQYTHTVGNSSPSPTSLSLTHTPPTHRRRTWINTRGVVVCGVLSLLSLSSLSLLHSSNSPPHCRRWQEQQHRLRRRRRRRRRDEPTFVLFFLLLSPPSPVTQGHSSSTHARVSTTTAHGGLNWYHSLHTISPLLLLLSPSRRP